MDMPANKTKEICGMQNELYEQSLDDKITLAKKTALKSKNEKPVQPVVTETELVALTIGQKKENTTLSPRKRSIKHTVMVYPSEDALIRQHAVEAGLSLSEYIRQSTVNNVLSERRSNDLRDASLDVFGAVRATIVTSIATIQVLYRGMHQCDDRDKLMSTAQRLTRAVELIDKRERELCS